MINGPAASMVVVESIPPHLRGTAVFASGLAYSVIGVLASVCATDHVLGHRLPLLFSLGLPFSGLALGMALWLKETPTYALLTAKDEAMAKQSLLFYHGLRSAEAQKKLEEMRREEEELNAENVNGLGSSLSQIKDLLVKKHLRRAVLVSISILQVGTAVVSFIGMGQWRVTRMPLCGCGKLPQNLKGSRANRFGKGTKDSPHSQSLSSWKLTKVNSDVILTCSPIV